MANKHQVIALNAKHPDWTARQIADRLNCPQGYVLATAKRQGLRLGSSTRGRGHGARPNERKFDYGKAADLRKSGLTFRAIGKQMGVHAESVRLALLPAART